MSEDKGGSMICPCCDKQVKQDDESVTLHSECYTLAYYDMRKIEYEKLVSRLEELEKKLKESENND